MADTSAVFDRASALIGMGRAPEAAVALGGLAPGGFDERRWPAALDALERFRRVRLATLRSGVQCGQCVYLYLPRKLGEFSLRGLDLRNAADGVRHSANVVIFDNDCKEDRYSGNALA